MAVHHLTGSKVLITLLNRMGHCSSYEEVQAVDTTFAMEVAAIAEFHIVRDWSEFYECRTKCFNMAATCGVEIQDSPTSSGCSTTKMKTDKGKK